MEPRPGSVTSAGSPRPEAWLAGCRRAHRRLDHLVDTLPLDATRRPSLLAGWSVGHVLSHLARNADSVCRVVEGAQQGEIVGQYRGGLSQRDAEIETGAHRAAQEIYADVGRTMRRLEAVWESTGELAWSTGLGLRGDAPMAIADYAFLRWREVELHMVDLGLADLGGPAWSDLDEQYLDHEWRWTTESLAGRVPNSQVLLLSPSDRPARTFGRGDRVVTARGTTSELLAWLTGRSVGGGPLQLDRWL